MMTQKLDFQKMSRKELRTYVLAHREDHEALRIYMERLHKEPGVIRQTGGLNEEDLKQLEELIKIRVSGDGEAPAVRDGLRPAEGERNT